MRVKKKAPQKEEAADSEKCKKDPVCIIKKR
jgi:hypothetical protein